MGVSGILLLLASGTSVSADPVSDFERIWVLMRTADRGTRAERHAAIRELASYACRASIARHLFCFVALEETGRAGWPECVLRPEPDDLRTSIAQATNEIRRGVELRFQALVRRYARDESERLDGMVEALLDELRSKSEPVRIRAANDLLILVEVCTWQQMRLAAPEPYLGALEKESMRSLRRQLAHHMVSAESAVVRAHAVATLLTLDVAPERSRAAVRAYARAINDDDAVVRLLTVLLLSRPKWMSDWSFAMLRDCLRDKARLVRVAAILGLYRYGPKALPVVRRALNDKDGFVRRKAAWCTRVLSMADEE